MAPFNYAQAYGIDSVAGAVIAATLYAPCLLFFALRSFTRPTYVFVVLALFSAVRVAAFALRALLAAVPQDGESLRLFITYEILYNVGFFGLLYSAYSLAVDRALLSDAPLSDGPVSRITRRRSLFRIVLAAAVAIGITGVVEAATGSTQHTVDLGTTLRKISSYIFLALCILVALQTLLLLRAASAQGTHKVASGPFGAHLGICVLCLVALLLLTRQTFFVVTANDTAWQTDERWWYPLAAVPEFVAVVLFAAPGLVPARSELPS